MKLRNTTDWPDHFLRRMTAWCCRQIELPVRAVRVAQFGRRRQRAFNGWATTGGRIRVVLGPGSAFPVQPHHYPGRTSDAFLSPLMNDRTEALVAVTAHEVTHIRGYRERYYEAARRAGRGERHTRYEERRVLELFRANREQLLAEWMKPPKARAVKPKPSRQEQNEAKARDALDRWERKLKLAKTKVAGYRRKVRYYERAVAAHIG